MPSTQGSSLHPGAHPYQSVRQQTTTIYTSPVPPPTKPGAPSPSLFTQLILPPPSDKGQRDPHTPLPLLCMVASVCGLWVQCGHLETTQAVRLKSGSSRTLPQFLNLPGCGENCIRKFQHEGGACCTGLPAGLPIKENPGGLVFSLQPMMDNATPLVDTT